MKKILAVIALTVLCAIRATTEPQIPAPVAPPSGVIALTTSTAIRLVPNPSTASPIFCNSIFIQPLAGNSAVVYVLNAPVGITMAYGGAGTTTVAQLGVGTSTTPGSSFTFPSNGTATSSSSGADLRLWGVTGTTGDSVVASCDLRN
jgi:hypothetical protein